MKNKKINIELDIEDLLGLKEPNKDSLEYDLNFIIENGIDKYIENQQKHEEEKRKFIELFKECFDELCVFMEKDSLHRVPISCYTCLKGMDLSKQYGRPKKR
ncbi:MAG: hypothetical protein SPK28_01440 [Bacilli bacterium]|nr:hypothetical protein [Bacilli bacterium]